MKSPSRKAVTEGICLAPRFLVDDLSDASGYYRDRLGFEPDFVYEIPRRFTPGDGANFCEPNRLGLSQSSCRF